MVEFRGGKERYASYTDFLAQVYESSAWTELQNTMNRKMIENPADAAVTIKESALRRIGRGPTWEYWEIHQHKIPDTLAEVWDINDVSLPLLKLKVLGMFMYQWLDEHAADTREESAAIGFIPASCSSAVDSVFTPTMTVDGVVLKTQQQVRRAAGLVDLNKNVQVGIFLVVCREAGAVKTGATNTDFVRALIGLGLLTYVDDKSVGKIAEGFRLKVNGGMKHGVRIQGLPTKHRLWKDQTERELGDSIICALMNK